MKKEIKITKGKVDIMLISDIGNLSNGINCLCWEITNSASFPLDAMLSGEREILIKIRPVEDPEAKPTIIHTGLKWKTFNLDDNINILVKPTWMGCIVFISKKDAKTIYMSKILEDLRK